MNQINIETRSEVIHESGELIEIGASKKKLKTADKAQLFAELKWLAGERGWSVGVLSNKFREITGVWPNAYRDVDPVETSQEGRNKVKSLQIAWLKSKRHQEWKQKKQLASAIS